MKAREFIKEYGWKEAKRRTEPNMIDMWDAGWGFYTSELKKYIDARELVRKYKGARGIRFRIRWGQYRYGDSVELNNQLKQAIALVEEVEA